MKPPARDILLPIDCALSMCTQDSVNHAPDSAVQVMNLWERDADVRKFVFGTRLARVAAELMGVSGVRLYHDQALCKLPGGGPTPWHADQACMFLPGLAKPAGRLYERACVHRTLTTA